MTFRWTEENTKIAVEMWEEGWSMLLIANKLKTSRNAVSGKMSRSRELFPIKGTGPAIREKQSSPLKKKGVEYQKPSSAMSLVLGAPKTVSFKEPVLDEFEIARLPGVSLVDNNGCMYPLTQEGPHRFCGEGRYEGKRYCRHHVDKTKGYSGIDIGHRASYDKNVIRGGDKYVEEG